MEQRYLYMQWRHLFLLYHIADASAIFICASNIVVMQFMRQILTCKVDHTVRM